MALKTAVNTFEGGMNKDVVRKAMKANSYHDARNVSISGDNENYSIMGMEGSVQNTLLSSTEASYGDPSMMAIVECQILNKDASPDEIVSGFAYIVKLEHDSLALGMIKIFLHIPSSGTNMKIYELSYNSDDFDHPDKLSAFAFSEAGQDYIYFTDIQRFLRKIPCIFETGTTYSDRETRLIPRSATDAGLEAVGLMASGGNLLTGKYDVYVRALDTTNNKASDWSVALSNIKVHNDSPSQPTPYDGTTGTVTNKKLSLSSYISTAFLASYDSFQYAVVEKIHGLQSYSTATLGVPIDVSAHTPDTFLFWDVKANGAGSIISIADLIIDDASIETAEAITTKNNRIIAGGIKYKNLTLDHPSGLPQMQSPSGVIVDRVSPAASPGYFRGECYRFGVVYYNEDGAFGPVTPLDFSAAPATYNFATSGTDIKFPDRTDNTDWAIFNGAATVATTLRINMDSIINHPTWAKGMMIVRAKRKKNILFQTPLIPSILVQPAKVVGEYPVLDSNGDTYEATVKDPDGSWFPKNFFRPWNYNIVQGPAGSGYRGTEYNSSNGGRNRDSTIFTVFDPNHIYGLGDPYEFNNGHDVRVVDIAMLQSNHTKYSVDPTVAAGSNNPGNYQDTEMHGTFAAVDGDFYYVNDSDASAAPVFDWTGGSANSSSKVADYQRIENFNTGVTMTKADSTETTPSESSFKFGDYQSIMPEGIDEGTPGNGLKMGVMALADDMADASHYCADATSSGKYFVNHAFVNTAEILGSRLTLPAALVDQNDMLEVTANTNAVCIVNIESGLGDDRYGEEGEQLEYYATDHFHSFTTAELTTDGGSGIEGGSLVPVATGNILGGDCFTTQHSFKISDNSFSVGTVGQLTVGAADTADDIIRWGRSFEDPARIISRTLPLRSVSQVITVFLESEVNAQVLSRNVYSPIAASLTYEYPSGASELKAPFLYDYSTDLSAKEDGKVFFVDDYTVTDNTNFPSRLVYSNQKIYNSYEEGFDRYPVLNFFDLEERYGDVSNLHTFKDRVYAFQENAISYIPISKGVIETADGINMSLQTGAIIGTPLFASTYHGASVGTNALSNNDVIFAIDRGRGAIIAFDGSSVTDLSSKGMETFFRGADYTDVAYDYSRKELIVYDRRATAINPGSNENLKFRPVIFSDKTKAWISEIDGTSTDFIGIAWQTPPTKTVAQPRVKNGLMAMAVSSENIDIHDMYENTTTTSIFGANLTPYIDYTINKEILNVKTFDGMAFYSDGLLAEAIVSTYIPEEDQDTTITFPSLSREGVYRAKTLRDSENRRMRSEYADVKLSWDPTVIANLSHTVMKYRISKRAITKEEDGR